MWIFFLIKCNNLCNVSGIGLDIQVSIQEKEMILN